MGIGGGDDHHHVHIRHDLLHAVGDHFRRGLALNNACHLDGLELLQAVDLFLVNVVKLSAVPLAGEDSRHALSAGTRTDNREFQHIDTSNYKIINHQIPGDSAKAPRGNI